MAIHGPSGSGKTWTALKIAHHLVPGGRIAVVDTERGSASKYAGAVYSPGGDKFSFLRVGDSYFNGNYNPEKFTRILGSTDEDRIDVIILDSIYHLWKGTGGFLELVDAEVAKMSARGKKPDSFAAWKVVDPIYNRFVQAIMTCSAHVIVTIRAKDRYERSEGQGGRTQLRKVGLEPEFRDGFQFEMDVEGMLDLDHNLAIGKTRCPALDGQVMAKPGEEIAKTVRAWLTDGAPAVVREPGSVDDAAPPIHAPASEPHSMGARLDEMEAAFLAICEKIDNAQTTDHLVAVKDQGKAILRGKWLAKMQGAYQARYRAIAS